MIRFFLFIAVSIGVGVFALSGGAVWYTALGAFAGCALALFLIDFLICWAVNAGMFG